MSKLNLGLGIFNLWMSVLIAIRYPFGNPYVWVSLIVGITGIMGIVYSLDCSQNGNEVKE